MAKVKSVKLVSFTLPNKIGQLAAVAELLSTAKVNITAIRAAESGSNAEFLLAMKDTAKAKKALAPLGVDVKEAEALCVEVPNKPGRLEKVAKKLAAASVNVHSFWATAFTGKTASGIFLTSDDKKAVAALKAKK